MNLREWQVFLMLPISLFLVGCGGPEVVFEEQTDLGPQGWAYADSVSYAYTISDTSQVYDLVLSIGHTPEFAFQNFYVRLTTQLPDGQVLQQPLSLQLANNFGDWYGDCSSTECSTDIALQEGTRFTDTGEYRLVVTQYSREDPLPAITGLGFRVVKHDE